MTAIWLSPGLPADRDGVAAALGPGYEMTPGSATPPADVVAVVSVYETELLRSLVARPDDVRLVLLTPPDHVFAGELADDLRPDLLAPARDDADVAVAIQGAFPGAVPVAGAGWWSGGGTVAAPAAAAAKPRRGGKRLQGIAVAVVLVAVLGAAVAVLTGGSSSSASAQPGAGAMAGGQGGQGGFGGGQGGTPPTMSATEKATLTACLEKYGVTTLPTPGAGTTMTAKERAAFQKCMPARTGGTGTTGGAGTGAGVGGMPATVPTTKPET